MKLTAVRALQSPKTFWWIVLVMLGCLLALEVGWYFSGLVVGKQKALHDGQLVIYSLKTGEVEGLPETMHKDEKKQDKPDAAAAPPEAFWKEYARPFSNPDNKPMVAIIITGLGMSKTTTEDAFNLPAEIGLSFSPYSYDVEKWIAKANGDGKEIYMDLPMEPEDYPLSDPGQQGLISSLDEGENAKRLLMVADRYAKRVGLVTPVNEKFTASVEALPPVLKLVYERGILLVRGKNSDAAAFKETTGKIGMPDIEADSEIDNVISTTDIAAALDRLTAEAKKNGSAIGIAHPYPVSLREIRRWVKELNAKGVVLAPVSAIAIAAEPKAPAPATEVAPAAASEPEKPQKSGE